MPHAKCRRAAVAALVVLPLTLASPTLAVAAVSTGQPAGLLPPLPGPVASLLPAPLASTVNGLLGGAPTASPTPSATASPASDPVTQLLNGVLSLLAQPSAVPTALLPTAVVPPALPTLPTVPLASLPTALRTQAVAGLTRTAAQASASEGDRLRKQVQAPPATDVPVATQQLTGTLGSATFADPEVAAPVAAVAEPVSLPVAVPAVVAARAARVAAQQKRTTDQVSNGLAALAFGCVIVAAGGQVAARRRRTQG